MKKFLNLKILLFLFATVLSFQITTAFAQQDPCSGLGAARRIQTNEQIKINFFRATTSGVISGSALSPDQIEAGFRIGDAVAIQASAPYCFYTYIVNVSERDGITLQYPSSSAENVGTRAGGELKIPFLLENISGATATTGREELLVLITKNKIENPDIQSILSNSGRITIPTAQVNAGQSLLRSSLTAPETPTAPTTPTAPGASRTTKLIRVLSIGCNVASIFFPFARIGCVAAGFGAARRIAAAGNAISVAPTSDTNQLVFRFSFPVKSN